MKFCPRCGAEMETRTLLDYQRRVCPQCDYIYWNNPLPVAGALVVDERGWVVMALRNEAPAKDSWNIPAGFMEWGESAETAACREVQEETGLEIELMGFLGSYGAGHRKWPWYSVTFIFFYARQVAGALQAGDDAAEVAFFPPDALPDPIIFSSNHHALRRWEADRRRGVGGALGQGSAWAQIDRSAAVDCDHTRE